MGEPLGYSYADPAKRLPVPAHGYRLCLVAGIQPARAAGILDDTDGGTPQRLVWLPATDPDAPEVAPPAPDPLGWRPPTWPAPDRATGRVVLPVCDTARAVVDAARLARIRGDGDALDGHALLCRLKVGTALALLRRSTAEQNRSRGEAEGERAVVVAEKVEDAAVRRVARLLARKLGEAPDGMRGAELRQRLPGRDRVHFDAAVDRLLGAWQVVREDVDGQGTAGVHYRRDGGAP